MNLAYRDIRHNLGRLLLTYQSVETIHNGRKLRLYVVGFEPGWPGGPSELVAGRPITRSHCEMIADR